MLFAEWTPPSEGLCTLPKCIVKRQLHPLLQTIHLEHLTAATSIVIWEFRSDVKMHMINILGPPVLPLLKKSNFKIQVWHYFVWTTTDFIKK